MLSALCESLYALRFTVEMIVIYLYFWYIECNVGGDDEGFI